jgi:hypothetical protein
MNSIASIENIPV